MYHNMLPQPAKPAPRNRAPSIAASGSLAGRILNVLPVTREFGRDRSSLVGYSLLTAEDTATPGSWTYNGLHADVAPSGSGRMATRK